MGPNFIDWDGFLGWSNIRGERLLAAPTLGSNSCPMDPAKLARRGFGRWKTGYLGTIFTINTSKTTSSTLFFMIHGSYGKKNLNSWMFRGFFRMEMMVGRRSFPFGEILVTFQKWKIISFNGVVPLSEKEKPCYIPVDASEIRLYNQLRLVDSPFIYKVLYIPGGCLGFLPSTASWSLDWLIN